jgi:hypothetical protein
MPITAQRAFNQALPLGGWVSLRLPFPYIPGLFLLLFCTRCSKSERAQIIITDMAFVGWCYMLGLLANSFGWAWLAKVYIMPIVWLYCWLVLVTLLHHTHPGKTGRS